MHVSSAMLHGGICPVTAAISSLGVGGALYLVSRSKNRVKAARFAAVTAFIFAAQMLNFPIHNGTSGHLLGGVLAASLLGIPLGILSMTLVLSTQCILFADGGTLALGANVLNMALIGSGIGGLLFIGLRKLTQPTRVNQILCIGIASLLSVILASVACSTELALSGTVSFMPILKAMTSVHALIGLGEAMITMTAFSFFSLKEGSKKKQPSFVLPLSFSVGIATILSPFASRFPDGLEYVAIQNNIPTHASSLFLIANSYSIPNISNEVISIGLAGLIGVSVTFCMGWGILKIINRIQKFATI